MIRPILQIPDARLHQMCDDVVYGDDARALLEDLAETCQNASGLGLAAPQIGDCRRAVVIRNPQSERVLGMLNPRIIKRSGLKIKSEERCLSVPKVSVVKKRNYSVTVKFINFAGDEEVQEFRELMSTVVQHELEHLDGITIA